ncbi:hypothetical protein [Methylobacterium nigriterrae]|uniref:hypothetical protein n=1 Tax=Methylobacterium nigriterrae TaxID=3127512 RepID=UPI0030136762
METPVDVTRLIGRLVSCGTAARLQPEAPERRATAPLLSIQATLLMSVAVRLEANGPRNLNQLTSGEAAAVAREILDPPATGTCAIACDASLHLGARGNLALLIDLRG